MVEKVLLPGDCERRWLLGKVWMDDGVSSQHERQKRKHGVGGGERKCKFQPLQPSVWKIETGLKCCRDGLGLGTHTDGEFSTSRHIQCQPGALGRTERSPLSSGLVVMNGFSVAVHPQRACIGSPRRLFG